MSKSKMKLVMAGIMFTLVLICSVAVVAIVFALDATKREIISGLNINYKAEGVNGSVTARYKVCGSSEAWTDTDSTYLQPSATDAGHILKDVDNNPIGLIFKENDSTTGSGGSLEFPSTTLTLTKNESVVIKYTYTNSGSRHYIASMSFNYGLQNDNMLVEYSIDGTTYSTDRYALVMAGVGTATAYPDGQSYWIKISVNNKAKDASFNGQFNWLLKVCDESSPAYKSMTSLEFKGSDGSYSVSLSNAGGQEGIIVIPSEINGDPVTTIVAGDMTNEEKAKVKEVVIPDSVTTIGSYAFYNFDGLTEIDLTANNIESGAFGECDNLQKINIGANVSQIYWSAFGETPNLTEIVVDENNQYFYSSNNCLIKGKKTDTNPKELVRGCKNSTIPDEVTIIGNNAFSGCGLTGTITIPENVTTINNNPFAQCDITGIEISGDNEKYYVQNNCLIEIDGANRKVVLGCNQASITIPEGVTEIGYTAFCKYKNLTTISLPNSLTTIGGSAFMYCTNLTSVTAVGSSAQTGVITLPESVTSIGSMGFYDCEKITKATIPSSVTEIVINPFGYCFNLTELTVASGNTKYYSENNCIIDRDTKTLIAGIPNSDGVCEIPNDVKVIYERAFDYVFKLTSVTIPASVTKILYRAFNGCLNLTNVAIGEAVEEIGTYAFQNCNSIESITIPESVKYIGVKAFSGCSKLKAVTFENSNNWFVSYNSSATSGTELDPVNLEDTLTAANYLTSTYGLMHWRKNSSAS